MYAGDGATRSRSADQAGPGAPRARTAARDELSWRPAVVRNLALLAHEHLRIPAQGAPPDVRAGHERRGARDHGAPRRALAALGRVGPDGDLQPRARRHRLVGPWRRGGWR